MKKHLNVFFVLMALLAAAACGKPENKPEAVLEAFFEALLEKDFEKGAQYCAPQSLEFYRVACSMLAMRPAGGSVSDILCTVSEDGESANCSATTIDGNGEETPNTAIKMVKVDGDWKVIVDKSK